MMTPISPTWCAEVRLYLKKNALVPVVVLSLPKKNVVDLFANERSQAEEFAVDPMQNSLETISLARVFTVKQLENLLNIHT